MKKWLLTVIGGMCIAGAGLFIVAYCNLGMLITYAVNTYGPNLLHAHIHLGKSTLSPLSGTATLRDFLLGNPEGFSGPHAVKINSFSMELDRWSLLRDTIVIRRIDIKGPDLIYEKRGGTDNFKALIKTMEQTESTSRSGTGSRAKQEQTGRGKKLVIKDLVITDGRVTLNLPQTAGKDVTVPLPAIHLKNIGSETGGATPAAIGVQVLAAVYEQITGPAMLNTIGRLLGTAGRQAEKAGAEAKKGIESFTNKVKKLFGK